MSLTDVPDLPEVTGWVAWVDPQLRFVILDLDDATDQRVLVGSRAIVCIEPAWAPGVRGAIILHGPKPEELVGREVQMTLRGRAPRPELDQGQTVVTARVTAVGPDWTYLVVELPGDPAAIVVPCDSILTITYPRPVPAGPAGGGGRRDDSAQGWGSVRP